VTWREVVAARWRTRRAKRARRWYCDHLPLYRQSAIYARSGVELERSTLAECAATGSGRLITAGTLTRGTPVFSKPEDELMLRFDLFAQASVCGHFAHMG
jgi:Transposase IS66 family